MKALIIGAAGFVGNHLINQLKEEGKWQIAVTKMLFEKIEDAEIEVFDLDILNKKDILDLLNKIRPDYIFHLAAQSSVAVSWSNPGLTIDVNIKGSINVLDAVRELDYKPRILLIGSSEEYGYVRKEEIPINEENVIRPSNIYAVTKATQNMIGRIYAEAYQMNVIMVRAFNHIGPNQSPQFVVADFCKQVVEIELGLKQPILSVGNLSAFRDFTDVRDVVCAYTKLVEFGNVGQTYNVGSGQAVSIDDILKMIIRQSKVEIKTEINMDKFRPTDVPIIEADVTKIYHHLKWKKQIPLEQTISDTLNYWRSILNPNLSDKS